MSPITRVVKLTLQPQYTEAFKAIFAAHQQGISQFAGCLELNAYQDEAEPHIFFTISRWRSLADLDNYRYSEFFKALWQQVKPMFAARAEAHSMTKL